MVAPHRFGTPWRFKARVAVPYGGRVVAALSGRTLSEGEQQGWNVTHVDSEGHVAYFPSVAAGLYKTVDDPAQLGFPAIRVRAFSTHYGTIDQFGPEARRIVQFYQGWLPPYPVREIEVFEAPRRFDGFVWVAPHGMVNLQVMLKQTQDLRDPNAQVVSNPRDDQPHLENAVFAHELAHQYWGHLAPPATIEDFWIAEAFSELFACMYVAAAFDAQDCQVRMAADRQAWESFEGTTEIASLSRAYSSRMQPAIVYGYGPYVLGEMLIRRIGREPFFAAIDLMLRDHPYEPLTTERLQLYLEAASGKDLDAFFDYWIHGGRVPALSLTWRQDGRTVTGTVTSTVPFGTFDVPVAVRTDAGTASTFVTVVDGAGTFRVEAPSADKVKVTLDPEGYVLASARRVARGEP